MRNLFSKISSLLCISMASTTFAQTSDVSVTDLTARAEKGNTEAEYMLGFLHSVGNLVPKNHASAKKYLKRAADKGDARAMHLYALLHDPLWFGEKGSKDIDVAIAFYQRSASSGHKASSFQLSKLKDAGYLKAEEVNAELFQRSASAQNGKEIKLQTVSKLESTDIFKKGAPGIVEVLGDSNYGSGVLVGIAKNNKNKKSIEIHFDKETLLFPYSLFKDPNLFESGASEFYFIVTNHHVLGLNKKVQIGLGSDDKGATLHKKSAIAACINKSRVWDLGLILVEKDPNTPKNLQDKISPFTANPKLPEVGARVYTIANPEKLVRSITSGLYSGLRKEGAQFDAPVSVGSSGGAFVDEQGKLLGIIVGFYMSQEAQNLNFAIPWQEVVNVFKKNDLECKSYKEFSIKPFPELK